MAFRLLGLSLIGVILSAEGYLLFQRYLYGPLNIIDWSGRVTTLDEKEQLLAELREKLNTKGLIEAPTSYELTNLVRSGLDPLAVCGMSRFKSKSGGGELDAFFDRISRRSFGYERDHQPTAVTGNFKHHRQPKPNISNPRRRPSDYPARYFHMRTVADQMPTGTVPAI